MEPFDDRELNVLLREWRAPGAPPALRERVLLRSRPQRWWQWLLRGTIRVPVPVGLAAAAAALWALFAITAAPAAPPEEVATTPVVSLADFTPVERVEPRIIGEQK